MCTEAQIFTICSLCSHAGVHLGLPPGQTQWEPQPNYNYQPIISEGTGWICERCHTMNQARREMQAIDPLDFEPYLRPAAPSLEAAELRGTMSLAERELAFKEQEIFVKQVRSEHLIANGLLRTDLDVAPAGILSFRNRVEGLDGHHAALRGVQEALAFLTERTFEHHPSSLNEDGDQIDDLAHPGVQQALQLIEDDQDQLQIRTHRAPQRPLVHHPIDRHPAPYRPIIHDPGLGHPESMAAVIDEVEKDSAATSQTQVPVIFINGKLLGDGATAVFPLRPLRHVFGRRTNISKNF